MVSPLIFMRRGMGLSAIDNSLAQNLALEQRRFPQ
jgi:hypothetical protein